jgi:UDPglucose--hexose-1-phosphate uridylyltransferase
VRAHRPGEARESVVKDAFREIIEGRDYAIPITLNEQLSDSPFSIEPVLCDSLKDYSAITIINRFPAMVSARYSQ